MKFHSGLPMLSCLPVFTHACMMNMEMYSFVPYHYPNSLPLLLYQKQNIFNKIIAVAINVKNLLCIVTKLTYTAY